MFLIVTMYMYKSLHNSFKFVSCHNFTVLSALYFFATSHTKIRISTTSPQEPIAGTTYHTLNVQ